MEEDNFIARKKTLLHLELCPYSMWLFNCEIGMKVPATFQI